MKAPAELVPGLPVYSLPSIIEGEFHNAAARAALFDGGLSEANRLITTLTHSIGSHNDAAHRRMGALEESSAAWRSELDDLHTQSADQLDCIAELESQLKEQDLLIARLSGLHQNLPVRFESHLKDFQHFIAEHFLPIQQHVILESRCSCFNSNEFVQSPIDGILVDILNAIIQRGLSSQDQVPVPVPNPSTRHSRVDMFTLPPARPQSPTPFTAHRSFICTPPSTNPPSPSTDQSIRSPSLATPFLTVDKGEGSDMPSLQSRSISSDGSMEASSRSGQEA